MKNKNIIQVLIITISVGLFFSSCKTSSNTTNEEMAVAPITIEAAKFVNKSENFSIVNNEVSKTEAEGWLQYNIDVPAAGRYKVELVANNNNADPVVCWIEDYIENKDGRTYNITGNMPVVKDSKVIKDGSPLNKGLHKIKLHAGKGVLTINKISLTLMLPHALTPKNFTQQTNGKELVLAWSDEFDGKGIPDTAKWTYDIGDWGWGNNELQYYTANREENARQENGNLVIEARKNDNGMAWSSARLTTRGKESFTYGKIEFRAKVPVGRGTWSAGWLLGDEYVDELSWPYCGEVDILENVGYEMDAAGNGKTHASIHCGAYYFKLNNQPTSIAEVKNMSSEFHTYTAEWTPEKISMFIDGKKYFDYSNNKTELAWPYNKSQNIILNLAIGGGWGGAKGVDPALSSQKMIIDYVRVYEWK